MSETRAETLARFNHQCETCGAGPATGLTPRKLHIHHRNGDHQDDRPENRALLCAVCHAFHHGAIKSRAARDARPASIYPKPRPAYAAAAVKEDLRALREAAGLALQAVAAELGISPSSLSLIESGYRRRGDVDLPERYRAAVRRLYGERHARVASQLGEPEGVCT